MKFKDLNRGDKFIGYDDSISDEKPYYIFMKLNIESIAAGSWNAVRLLDGQLSKMTDNMEVLRIE